MIDSDYHGEIGFSLHSGGKKGFVWNAGDPLGGLAVIVVKLQQSDSVRMIKGTDSSGVKV